MSKEKKNSVNNRKRKIYQALMLLCAAGFILCVGIMVRQVLLARSAQEKYDNLASETVGTTADTGPETEAAEAEDEFDRLSRQYGIEVPRKEIDWESLRDENADIYAWIYIPDTNVDYPVVQHATDNNYYLEHNLDGSAGRPGTIFSQNYNKTDFRDPNTVLYGHDMHDATMFHTLHNFEDNVFFEEHPYIYIYTPEEILIYEIYAACEFSDAHILGKYDFSSTTGFQDFIDAMKGSRGMNDHVRNGTGIGTDRHVLTLSTCIKGKPNNRYLVSSVLVNEPDEVR